MSKAASSPTARLLQSSRLFSLPRPLPVQSELSTGVYKASETATTPYPTHQAITTPASSLHRGDWGLKRRIPGRKTAVTTPVIKVRANDTYEHITDFTSAGDHVQTERKWAEMEVPLIHKRDSRYEGKPTLSVFEEWLDNTDPNVNLQRPEEGRRWSEASPKEIERWKYKGPYLAGMQDGEFNSLLERTVVQRKSEWREFLSGKLREQQIRQGRQRLSDEPLDDDKSNVLEPRPAPTQQQVSAYEKQLRDRHPQPTERLRSDLTALICEFLDLPSVYAGTRPEFSPSAMYSQLIATPGSTGPPTTHPSAGLSHLRTHAVMHNHPIYGPQQDKPPVEARVVLPRTPLRASHDQKAKLGVGGVVADDDRSATDRNSSQRNMSEDDKRVHAMDENIEGGNKIWVYPQTARIDPKSRIVLQVDRATAESVAVKNGDRQMLEETMASKSSHTYSTASRRSSPGRLSGLTGLDRQSARSENTAPRPSSAANGPRGFGAAPGTDNFRNSVGM